MSLPSTAATIINDFNAQAIQLPLSGRTVKNHAETILVVLKKIWKKVN
jgi:hypothetical protein